MGKSGLFWTPFVFVRYVLVFAIGIIFGVFYISDVGWQTILYTSVLGLVILNLLFFTKQQVNRKIIFGILALSLLFLLGVVRVKMSKESLTTDHLLNQKDSVLYYTVAIDYFFQEREKVWKTVGKVNQVKTKNGWHKAEGKIQLYFYKKDFETIPNYGDELLIKGSPQVLQEPKNPGEFNIKEYLSFKQIYHQHFVSKENYGGIISTKNGNPILFYALQARNKADEILKSKFSNPERLEVMRALVLGVTDGIDEEMTQAYAAAGAMHVLAVSGMHVTILYTLLMGLAKPFGKRITHSWFLALVSLLFMWSYAFITGWSPSVMRSAVMISIFVLSKPLNRKGNVFNSIALSAFILLLWDPFMLMSVGFQLSYLAVLGIVVFQNLFYRLFETPNYFVDQIWKVSAVSMAAQLATLPLGLLYFHQFPVYFIFSNLIVIPVSTIALVGGLSSLIFSFSDFLSFIIVWITDNMIWIMNQSVSLVEKIPGSVIKHIYINTLQSWLLLFFVFGLWIFWQQRHKFGLWLLMLSITFLFLFHLFLEMDHRQKNQLIIHYIRNQTSIERINDNKSDWYCTAPLTENKSAIRMHIEPGRLKAGISPESIHSFNLSKSKDFVFIHHNNKVLAIINRKPQHWPDFKIDYFVVSHHAVLPKHIPVSQQDAVFLLDASNKLYFTKLFEREATNRNIKYLILNQSLTL